jgi:hypothetical protein
VLRRKRVDGGAGEALSGPTAGRDTGGGTTREASRQAPARADDKR